MDELAFLLLIPLFMLVASVLGVMAFVRVRRLEQQVSWLQRQLLERSAAPVSTPAREPIETTSATAPATAPTTAPVDALASVPPDPAPADLPAVESGWQRPSASSGSSASSESPFLSPSWVSVSEPSIFDRLFDHLRQHWMIWLGGICVGLAGVFMVRYSIEQGLLGPQARVLLSLLTGAGLHGGAEWLRCRRGANPVFAALAGGASIILYAALLAAFRLIPDTSPTLMFIGMALVSFATMALALKHGPLLAALGMLGGYLVPILVNTGSGNIAAALVYISILTLFALALQVWVERRWLLQGVIAGSLLWWALSLDVATTDGVRSLYLLVLAYLLLAVPRFDWGLRASRDPDPAPGWWQRLLALRQHDSHWPVLPALVLVVLAQTLTLLHEGPETASLFTWLALPCLLLLAASRRPEFNLLPALMLPLMLAASLLPWLQEQGDQLLLVSPDLATQAALANRFVLLTLVLVAVSVWLLRAGIRYPAFWIGLGSAAPLLTLTVSYYLFPDLRLDWVWGLVAIVLGLGYLGLAARETRGQQRALISVILISAGHLALTLAAVIWLAEATLTLALALQLVSLAWLQRSYQLPLLVWVIRAVLLLVVLRLTFNPWLLTYDTSTHWSLWTYGGATLCTVAAAWILRTEAAMQPWLQGGAAQLLVLTLATEVRYWLYDGDIFQHRFSFTEASLDVVIWGTAALIYFWRAGQPSQRPGFYRALGWLHLGAAAAVYLLVLLLADNPLWSRQAIGSTPILNILLLSYGMPTLIMVALWRILPSAYRRYAALAAGLNLLWFVSLEIHHLWQGSTLLRHPLPDGELYSYSVVWMLMAAVALALGGWLGKRDVYRAGMALLLVVVAKLFLIDMAGLTGLWRVASFMGLGLALLGLAWLHQHLGRSLAVHDGHLS